jgi:two-component system sensor histidine kinase KdpD
VDERPGSAALVRYTRRLADRLRASWTALNIETARTAGLSDAERSRVAEALRIAERLGAEAVTIPAVHVADGVIDYAHANNFTHIVVSTSHRSRWWEMLRPSAAHEIIRRAGDISIHVVPEQELPERKRPDITRYLGVLRVTRDPRSYAGSLLMTAVALGVGLVLQQFLGITNIALVFLTAVLAAAITYGLWPALFASLVSVLAFNFFFLPPLYTFRIAEAENVNALFFFAVVAFIASNLTSRVRAQAVVARERAKATEDLYLFARKLAGVFTLDDLLWSSCCRTMKASLSGPAIRPRTCWRMPISPRRNGCGSTAPKPAAALTLSLVPSGCFFPCAQVAVRSASLGSIAKSPARCSPPINAGCSTLSPIRPPSPSSV